MKFVDELYARIKSFDSSSDMYDELSHRQSRDFVYLHLSAIQMYCRKMADQHQYSMNYKLNEDINLPDSLLRHYLKLELGKEMFIDFTHDYENNQHSILFCWAPIKR